VGPLWDNSIVCSRSNILLDLVGVFYHLVLLIGLLFCRESALSGIGKTALDPPFTPFPSFFSFVYPARRYGQIVFLCF